MRMLPGYQAWVSSSAVPWLHVEIQCGSASSTPYMPASAGKKYGLVAKGL